MRSVVVLPLVLVFVLPAVAALPPPVAPAVGGIGFAQDQAGCVYAVHFAGQGAAVPGGADAQGVLEMGYVSGDDCRLTETWVFEQAASVPLLGNPTAGACAVHDDGTLECWSNGLDATLAPDGRFDLTDSQWPDPVHATGRLVRDATSALAFAPPPIAPATHAQVVLASGPGTDSAGCAVAVTVLGDAYTLVPDESGGYVQRPGAIDVQGVGSGSCAYFEWWPFVGGQGWDDFLGVTGECDVGADGSWHCWYNSSCYQPDPSCPPNDVDLRLAPAGALAYDNNLYGTHVTASLARSP